MQGSNLAFSFSELFYVMIVCAVKKMRIYHADTNKVSAFAEKLFFFSLNFYEPINLSYHLTVLIMMSIQSGFLKFYF